MDFIINVIAAPLGWLMKGCYDLLGSYGPALCLFTLLAKIVLLPIAVWVHKNSIKLIRMQAELNAIRARYAGDREQIAEEQMKLYQRAHYSPMAGVVPMLVQIPVIFGLINVIYQPLKHLFGLPADVIETMVATCVNLTGAPMNSAIQLKVVECLQTPSLVGSFTALAEQFPGVDIPGAIARIQRMNMQFLGVDLSVIPTWSNLLYIPVLAGLSTLALCLVQNRLNVLQAEQSTAAKWGTSAFTIAFSTYFAFIIPAGVGFYWILGNLLSIVQQLLLNLAISPKKYIDYDALEQSKQQLEQSRLEEKRRREAARNDPYRQKEKRDYRRFFDEDDKQLVIYSERGGFYKYFSRLIDAVLRRSDVVIHYVTSDPRDPIFDRHNPRIEAYYISDRRLATFFMKMDADMVVMTMPDLNQFHIKRSLVRKDVEYVYMFHYPLSTHMVLRKGALDAFDTIFMVGPFQEMEIRQTEALYGLPPKKLVPVGYGLLEDMQADFDALPTEEHPKPRILLAPSWQADNLLDTCLDPLLKSLLGQGFDVTVRPHPEYMKRYQPRMAAIQARWADYDGGDLHFECDFTSSASIFTSDVVITDWSGTAYEFALVTKRPAVFIDTPPKINNPEYDRIKAQPLELTLRDQAGVRLDPEKVDTACDVVRTLLADQMRWKEDITRLHDTLLYNFGFSGDAGADYLLPRLKEYEQKRLQEEED